MKVKRQNLCHTCRRRKLQCDGKLPACSQCRNSKRHCEGYPEVLFVPFIAAKCRDQAGSSHDTTLLPQSQSRSMRMSPPASSPVGFSEAPKDSHRIAVSPNDLLPMPSIYSGGLSDPQECISVIIRNYLPADEPGFGSSTTVARSQVCGSWVAALPELTLKTSGAFAECLHSASGALAMSITAYRTRRNMLCLVATQYEHSLHLLARSLGNTGNVYRNELVAAVMCLALVEILSPTNPSSWLVHVEGVSKMIQLSTPSHFASNVEHTLFIGFRPILILEAFIHRKATFLADDAWVRLPFQIHRAAPMQSLLGVVASIPEILETIDAETHQGAMTMDVAQERITELLDAVSRLECWHSSYLKMAESPLVWHQTLQSDANSKFEVLWYQDLGTANVFTYFWAFQLVCLETIQRLFHKYPELEQSVHLETHNAEECRRICIKLGIQICQSMQYVLQEEFMLYGVSSANFPLQIAYRMLKLDKVD